MKETSLALTLSAFTFMLAVIWGGPLLRMLRQLKIGKLIRVEEPDSHITKMGTPTMGGVMIIVPVIFVTFMLNAASLIGLNVHGQSVHPSFSGHGCIWPSSAQWMIGKVFADHGAVPGCASAQNSCFKPYSPSVQPFSSIFIECSPAALAGCQSTRWTWVSGMSRWPCSSSWRWQMRSILQMAWMDWPD